MPTHFNFTRCASLFVAATALLGACQPNPSTTETTAATKPAATDTPAAKAPLSQPLVKDIYTADPSAHVFTGYIFYHDTQLSGKTWLRDIKVTELKRRADGGIETIVP